MLTSVCLSRRQGRRDEVRGSQAGLCGRSSALLCGSEPRRDGTRASCVAVAELSRGLGTTPQGEKAAVGIPIRATALPPG